MLGTYRSAYRVSAQPGGVYVFTASSVTFIMDYAWVIAHDVTSRHCTVTVVYPIYILLYV